MIEKNRYEATNHRLSIGRKSVNRQRLNNYEI
ncbi:MAG: hypothetical protein RIR02_1039, partial [Pseudomonadota bacterium]